MALTNITTFDLEAAPGGSAPVINASQGDIGRQFQANLYWNGETWTPGSGVTCKLRGHKPDNTVFEYTATISGSTVTFSTTEQMTIIDGAVDCELVFTQNSNVIASANFVLQVEESPYDPNNLSESDVEGLTDVLAGFQRLNRDTNGVVKIGDGVTASGTNEPIKGFYVHDEVTDADGVAKVDYYEGLENAPVVRTANTPNVLDQSSMTSGYISDVNGTISASAAYVTSDFIPVAKGKQVTISPRARKVLTYYPNKYPLVTSYVDVQTQGEYCYTPTIDGFIRVTFYAPDVRRQVYEYNLLNESAIVSGYMSDNTGTVSAGAAYITSDYIPVKANTPVIIKPRVRKVLEFDETKIPRTYTFVDTTSQNDYLYTPRGDGFIRVTMYAADEGNRLITLFGASDAYEPYGTETEPNVEQTHNLMNLEHVEAYINSIVQVVGQSALNIKTADATVQNTAAVIRLPLKTNTKYRFSFKVDNITGNHAVVWTRLINSSSGLYSGFIIVRPVAGERYFGYLETNDNVSGLHIMLANSVTDVEARLSELMIYETSDGQAEPFNEPLEYGFVDKVARAAANFDIANRPLSAMPDYIKNTLAYKPVGTLSKPYICLTCDDGEYELATYTIPMLINKGVPCTFGLWSTSHALTASLSTVVDAINNHGCELSQHGETPWTEYTEDELVQFFREEGKAFSSMGMTPKSAICPSHYINKMVKAVAGGYFNVVRCGYDGHVETCENFYDYYANGPRNNQYALTSFNPKGHTLEYMKAALDYCIANNYLCMVYFHDWDLGDGASDRLEGLIDYAKAQGVSFCTLSEVEALQ